MEATQSFGIDFITRKCKADKNRVDIFARITVNGEIKELSIKQQIDDTNWDNRKEIVKGRTLAIKSINHHIDNVRYRIKEKYRTLEDKGELITAESVKSAYLVDPTMVKWPLPFNLTNITDHSAIGTSHMLPQPYS